MTQSAAEVPAETRRMRGRKPRAPQYYNFDAALNVRPPFFKIVSEGRLEAHAGSLLAHPAWPDGYARQPRHPWRLPDYREPPRLLFDKKFGRPGVIGQNTVSPAPGERLAVDRPDNLRICAVQAEN